MQRPPKRLKEEVAREMKRLTGDLETAKNLQTEYDVRSDFQLAAARDANVELPDNWPATTVIFLGNEIRFSIPAREHLSVFFRFHGVKKNTDVKIQASAGRGHGCFARRNFKKVGTIIGVYAGHLRKYFFFHLSPLKKKNLFI